MSTYRHLPKIGFSNHNFKSAYQIVNLSDLERSGLEGVVGPDEMALAGLIKKAAKAVKVLGQGELTRGMVIRAHRFSRSAAEKVKQAGGTAEVI